MGKFQINPQDASYTLPKGEYEVMVTGAVQKSPKQGEHDFIEVSFVVVKPDEFMNRTFSDRLSLSPKAKARMASFVVACGLVPAGAQGVFEGDTDDFKGRVLVVRGEPESFKGFEQFRVNRFEMHPSVAKEMEAKAQGTAPTSSAGQPAAAAPTAAAKPVRKIGSI